MFRFLIEAFFFCLRTAAEKNSFEDQVLQAAHGRWEIRNIFIVILNCLLILFCLGTSLRTICHFDPKAFEFYIIAEKDVKIKVLGRVNRPG